MAGSEKRKGCCTDGGLFIAHNCGNIMIAVGSAMGMSEVVSISIALVLAKIAGKYNDQISQTRSTVQALP